MKNEKQQWVSIKVDDETTAIAEQIERELAGLGIKASKSAIYGAILKVGSASDFMNWLIEHPVKIFKINEGHINAGT